MKRLPCWTLLFALLIACGDTLPRTQVMLVIDAEPGVRAQTDEVQLVIRGGTGAMSQWQERLDRSFVPGDNAEWPMELALVPISDDASRVYEATATAMSTSGALVARVRAISGYQAGKTLVLRLLFEDACRDQVAVCDATQTCRAGTCVDADVDAMSLETFKPGGGSDAGGTGGSGGSADAGMDSGLDATIIADASIDSGVDASDVNECLSTNVCTVDYPCQNLPSGYTCRGQFPDWAPTPSSSAFTANGDGTVTDSRSALVWQQAVDPGLYDQDGAKNFCVEFPLAGGGWRLPTKAELESIVEFDVWGPAIDSVAFPSTPTNYFWTSSPHAADRSAGWVVLFSTSQSSLRPATGVYLVRCVR